MTKAEEAYQDKLRALGCIVCWIYKNIYTPAEIHHRLSGGRRMGEKYVLPLCVPHHRGGFDNQLCTSRDHSQRRFERRYGKEEWLQEQANERIRIAA